MSILVIVLVSIAFGAVAYSAAQKKGRNPISWFILGFLLGPLALVIFLLPSVNREGRS